MHLPISVKNCRYDKAMSTSEQLAADLKNTGLKVTIPRIKVLTIFEQSKTRHLSAEDVYKQMLLEDLDVGLATVYRVLTQFEQAGILRRSNFEAGKAVFELDQGSHHEKSGHEHVDAPVHSAGERATCGIHA